VNAWTIGRFLLGQATAIREVAGNRAALWTGIVLVLVTAIARNYDQNYVLESPLWLFGPLIFSFFSGSFLYGILIRGFAQRRFDQDAKAQWPSFMALFWMTAPIAWLYAIPVERFLNSYQAAQANLTLLGIVSVWRVLLMSRAMAVSLEVSFFRALGWVLIAASLEIIIVVFIGALTSGALGRRILASMMGMRNAPEEILLSSVLSSVWTYSWIVLATTIIAINVFKSYGPAKPLPRLVPARMPWIFLALISVAWICIALPPQKEQQRFVTHAEFLKREDYAGALKYLASHEARDFPPSRRLEPNPYEFQVWNDLPPTIALLNSNTPPWIRQKYLSHLTATLSHYYSRYESLTNVAAMYAAVENLPEGREWVLSNQVAIARSLTFRRSGTSSATQEARAESEILATFRRMGMAETNLNTPSE